MKQVLLIDFFYPPIGTSHAYRWYELCEHLQNDSLQISLITSKSMRRKAEYLERVAGDFFEVGACQDRLIAYDQGQGSQKLRRDGKLKGILRRVNRSLFWPDAYWYWLPSLLLLIFKLWVSGKLKSFDGLITYSPTFGSHIAGLLVKKAHPSLKWIADYGDPFSNSYSMPVNNYKIYGPLNRYIEKLVFTRADFITCTNEKTIVHNAALAPEGNFVLLNHSINVDDYKSSCEFFSPEASNTVELVYIGAFHKGIREPIGIVNFFNAIESEFQFYLKFFGPMNGFKIESTNASHHGVVEKDAAIELIKSSPFLLNIENHAGQMSPSKLVELVASGRPIINYSDAGYSEVMLSAAKYGQVLNINKHTSAVEVDQFVNRMGDHGVDIKAVRDLVGPYDNKTVAAKLLKMLS